MLYINQFIIIAVLDGIGDRECFLLAHLVLLAALIIKLTKDRLTGEKKLNLCVQRSPINNIKDGAKVASIFTF